MFLLVAAALLGLLPATLIAQSGLTVPKSEDAIRDAELVLPAYPQASALINFPTSWSSHAILFDQTSLQIGSDGVIRYALVVRSQSGAENVTYEGLRCATGERRVFAYGRKTADGGLWSVARTSNWVAITDSRINRHYFELWRDVFCEGNRVEQRQVLLENLKRGGRERASGLPSD